MNYKDTLDSFADSESLTTEIPLVGERAEEISQDMHNALSDGSVFGELFANSIGEAVAQAIDKSGLDNLANHLVEKAKTYAVDAVQEVIGSDKFVDSFSEKMAQAEATRELETYLDSRQKEMEL